MFYEFLHTFLRKILNFDLDPPSFDNPKGPKIEETTYPLTWTIGRQVVVDM